MDGIYVQQSLRVSPLPSQLHSRTITPRRRSTPPPSGGRSSRRSSPLRHVESLDAELLQLVKQFREHVEPGIGHEALEAALRYRKQHYTTAEDELILRQAVQRCRAYMRNVESVLHRAVERGQPLERAAVHASYLRWRTASHITHKAYEVLDSEGGRRAVAVGRLSHEGASPEHLRSSAQLATEAVPTPRSCAGRKLHPSPSYANVAAMWRRDSLLLPSFSEDISALNRPYNEAQYLNELQRIQEKGDVALTTEGLQRAQELMELLYGEEEGLAAFELWLSSLPVAVLRQYEQQLRSA